MQQRLAPRWPETDAESVVLLVDTSSRFEFDLVLKWAEANHRGPYEIIKLPPSRRRPRYARLDPRLEARLSRGDDPLLLPIRVVWWPELRQGRRSVQWIDVLKFGDPRDPDPLRQRWISARYPDRVVIMAGEPARADRLRADWSVSGGTRGLGDFVHRRAWLALERSERQLRGNRYKVPRFIAEEIATSGEFRDGVASLAADRSYPAVSRQAVRYLEEIAANHSPLLIDLVANLIHWLYKQGYGSLNYDRDRLLEIYSQSQDSPLVFLPSHKSQLDRLILQFLLWENDLPPNHTAGGINLNFFPLGPLVRRTGVFFIRRSFRDNEVYKFVLRSYVDHLIAKNFSLEWYPEGGRSRSGKLLPPKYGMLGYVVDSFRRGKADDIILVPTAITYDQIQFVKEYAREQRGEDKESESLSWLVRSIRALRSRYGSVHVRFGDPVSLAKEMVGNEEDRLAVQKLAFEVMFRIGEVMPITPSSLVTLALLASDHEAVTAEQLGKSIHQLVRYIERRNLPVTEPIDLGSKAKVDDVMGLLAENGLVTIFQDGPETVYRIASDQELEAAYYRNTIVHFFVNGAIVELALLRVIDEAGDESLFWEEVMRLRDLLKFEFFFRDKAKFMEQIEAEMLLSTAEWKELLAGGEARQLLKRVDPLQAHWTLRPFLEAYAVVAETLESSPDDIEDKELITKALGLGRQYVLQNRHLHPESVSTALFKSAISLVDNRELRSGEDRSLRRQAFHQEVADVLERTVRIADLAREQTSSSRSS